MAEEASDRRTVRARLEGHVQGVGFRTGRSARPPTSALTAGTQSARWRRRSRLFG